MRKKRRVPEVLWRLYRNRARTLAETIISLLPRAPPSAADCRCKGRRCLGCSGATAMSFLLRPHDPQDYRKLLNRCFAVIPDDMPPVMAFYPDCRWPQLQIVRRTIEMLMWELPTSSNVICNGYNKCIRLSPVVDLLTTSAWGLLLERIGDDVMVHLLKYASIFLPLSQKNYYQVAGSPISYLGLKFSKHASGSYGQQPSPVYFGPQKKRKRDDDEGKYKLDNIISLQQNNSSLGVNFPSGSGTCYVGCNHKSSSRSICWQCRSEHSQMSFLEANVLNACTATANEKKKSNGELQLSSNKTATKTRKRLRPFSWQRRRKHWRLTFLEDKMLPTCTTIHDKENLYGKIQQSSNTRLSHHSEIMVPFQEPAVQHERQVHSETSTSQCFCCLMLQAPSKIPKGAQIDKHFMFYKSGYSSSLLPRNHILNSLKANDTGAIVLMRDIFGVSAENFTSQAMPCLQGSGFCHIGSACLYHSLLDWLKILIRKARCCEHLKLLDRHCAVPYLDQNTNRYVGSFEGNESQTDLLNKGQMGVQLECNLLENADGHVSKQQENNHKKTLNAFRHQFELNDTYCPKSQVVSFIWAVCRNIVPPDLLGSPSNWRALRRNISKFVRLRRFEKFCLKQCMHGLKTSFFPLLLSKNFLCYFSNHVVNDDLEKGATSLKGNNELRDAKVMLKKKVFESWIYWLFTHLVVPIVHANFYVTESELGKQDIFYYRKPIWEKITHRAIALLKEQSYHLLDYASLRNILSKRAFGFSKIRFCPKENGVRVLANLKATSKIPLLKSSLKDHSRGMQKKAGSYLKSVKFDHFKSVNFILRDLHVVLKGIMVRHPEKLGSSVFDYNDVYRKLCPFLIGLKNGLGTISSVFVVICDVSKAFDSVDQDKLLLVMKDVILNDEYHVKQSSQVVCTKKSLWVRQNQTLLDQNISTGVATSTASVSSYSLHSLLINQEIHRNIRKEELYHDLKEHVKHNVLQLGRNFYLQEMGIPQGSVLSSLLCSYYYGHLERNVILPFLEKIHEPHIVEPSNGDLPVVHNSQNDYAAQTNEKDDIILSSSKHMLMRFIDDFLFISTSKKQATSFFSRLQRGFREYNCSMNKEKFCMNFEIDNMSRLSSNRVYIGEDGISFLPWSGLLINCCTLEIQADYTRYLNIHLSSTLTVCWQGKPGCHLKAKLCDYMRPKCHPIFYDSNINSAAVVRLNIHQAFLLSAMKFHCYACDLSNICTLQAVYYSEIIQKSFRYMHKLIKKRMHSVTLGLNFRPILQLSKEEVEWLGLNAYIRVLKRKQSRHRELLLLLRSKLFRHGIMESASSELKYAIDDSHSSVFWKIKY